MAGIDHNDRLVESRKMQMTFNYVLLVRTGQTNNNARALSLSNWYVIKREKVIINNQFRMCAFQCLRPILFQSSSVEMKSAKEKW